MNLLKIRLYDKVPDWPVYFFSPNRVTHRCCVRMTYRCCVRRAFQKSSTSILVLRGGAR